MIHGRISTYVKHKCRCPACTDANRAYHRQYAARNRERIRQYSRDTYVRHRATIRARQLEYRRVNRETINAQNRASAARSRDDYNARSRVYYAANRDLIREKHRAYQQRTRLAHATRQAARRSRLSAAAGYASAEQIAARIDYFAGLCWMCHKPADTLDHVIPLARGGSNWPANLRPACKSCNVRKGVKLPSALL